jgi:NTE family protein
MRQAREITAARRALMRIFRYATLLAAVGVTLGGCATTVFNKANNVALAAETPRDMGAPQDFMGENSIILAFSGGGLRAAAFSHGVLSALESVKTPEGDLLDDLALISSVSGGSLTAAHYGVYGREGLARFRNEVLLPGFESGMRLSLNPVNFMRIMGGGLNTREEFGDTLDRTIFHGATFADIYRHPRPEIRIHATDLYYRVPFPFITPVFVYLCSDISRYSVADAVAASMAVPVVFAPVVVRSFPGECGPLPGEIPTIHPQVEGSRAVNAIGRALSAYRDPSHVRYIKLADGGLTDNFGVSTLAMSRAIWGTPFAPMSERDAVKIRRLLVVVVDASLGPHGDWTRREDGPEGLDLALAATDAAVDATTQHVADLFDRMIHEWQQSVVNYRCGLTPADVARLGGPSQWNCSDVKFSLAYLSVGDLASPMRERIEAVPTRLTLDAAQIDTTIEAGREGTLALPRLGAYLKERVESVRAR